MTSSSSQISYCESVHFVAAEAGNQEDSTSSINVNITSSVVLAAPSSVGTRGRPSPQALPTHLQVGPEVGSGEGGPKTPTAARKGKGVIRHAVGQEHHHTLLRLNNTSRTDPLFSVLSAQRYAFTCPSSSSGFTLSDALSTYETGYAHGATMQLKDTLFKDPTHAADYNVHEIDAFAAGPSGTAGDPPGYNEVNFEQAPNTQNLPGMPIDHVYDESIRGSPPPVYTPADVPGYTLDAVDRRISGSSRNSSTRSIYNRDRIDGGLEMLGYRAYDDSLHRPLEPSRALDPSYTKGRMQRLHAKLGKVKGFGGKFIKQVKKKAKGILKGWRNSKE